MYFKQTINSNKLRNKLEQFGGRTEKRIKRDKLMEVCGMPKNYNPTSHCFNDSTHHTCCMLGPKAKKYADESGNPSVESCQKGF